MDRTLNAESTERFLEPQESFLLTKDLSGLLYSYWKARHTTMSNMIVFPFFYSLKTETRFAFSSVLWEASIEEISEVADTDALKI